VIRHQIENLEVYSLYAHLREIRNGLKVGEPVRRGDIVALMGRTANTREGISRERAHVHFELNLYINDRFPAWYKKNFPGQRNDHSQWNGQNLVGLDPRAVFLEQRRQGDKFRLSRFVQSQAELCRVVVRDTDFPWLKRYAALVRPNPRAAREGVAGYEIALNFNAIPIELVPRAASEIKGKSKFQLVSVNAAEESRNSCRNLVRRRGSHWELTQSGLNALSLLTY
jgi:murein DD-endopeptidase MepM/ murein hydrolase activator NlpD